MYRYASDVIATTRNVRRGFFGHNNILSYDDDIIKVIIHVEKPQRYDDDNIDHTSYYNYISI